MFEFGKSTQDGFRVVGGCICRVIMYNRFEGVEEFEASRCQESKQFHDVSVSKMWICFNSSKISRSNL